MSNTIEEEIGGFAEDSANEFHEEVLYSQLPKVNAELKKIYPLLPTMVIRTKINTKSNPAFPYHHANSRIISHD